MNVDPAPNSNVNIPENGVQPQPEQPYPDAINPVNGNVEELEAQHKLTSNVWPHFNRVRVNRVMNARCKYCRKSLGGETSNGTSHMRSHIKTCIQKRIHDGSQNILGPNYQPAGNPQLFASQYNSEVSRKELCSMILVHEYPLSLVDHVGFKHFCCSLQPQFAVPSRNMVKKDILGMFGVERSKYQSMETWGGFQ
ncbi:unnamed protein product [Linum tenue]|uniref:BED-type domain-containing protein n=1 Tax=Linum tenue TaxID=586396 RepID=A0AAV0HX83_9ROSI|nr:unnamed protein product [Linum tenue]